MENAELGIQSDQKREAQKSEENVKEHNKVAEAAKKEYAEVYERLVNKLSFSHLEPFANTLLAQEKYVIANPDGLIKNLKEKMLKEMHRMDDFFWEAFNVSDGLTQMEMLYAKFKQYEGTKNWYSQEKTARERNVMERVRLHLAEYRALRTNLDCLQERQDALISQITTRRSEILEAERRTTLAMQAMTRVKESYQLNKPKLDQMQAALLATDNNETPAAQGDNGEFV